MTQSLFDEWRAYEKLVENDYMGHSRFFRALEEEVKHRFKKSIAILDLGCGDALPIRGLLMRLDAKLYCGVDASVTALSKAERNLAPLDIPYHLHSGDLKDVLRNLPGGYDVIVASYAFHHLVSSTKKEDVLRECRRVLNRHGIVLVVDVFRSEGESREAYLQRWQTNAKKKFTTLNQEEMKTLIDHVWSSDFPEPLSTYKEIGARSGYERVVALAEDDLNKLVILTTSTLQEACEPLADPNRRNWTPISSSDMEI